MAGSDVFSASNAKTGVDGSVFKLTFTVVCKFHPNHPTIVIFCGSLTRVSEAYIFQADWAGHRVHIIARSS